MLNESQLLDLMERPAVAPWRCRLAHWVESPPVQRVIVVIIVLNAIILGLETDHGLMQRFGGILKLLDRLCLIVFILELTAKITAYRGVFWRNGWNCFDFIVVGIALVPGAGPLSVLRSLRVLRVLRLLTAVPSLRRVIGAFFHSIPGLSAVVMVMGVFFYTASVLATALFGASHPQWFGSIGKSLYSLFQIMTLESWSMGIVRPVMEVHPWAWLFFIPFIMIATFTILNLFIGIIVSTMQELSLLPEPLEDSPETAVVLGRIEIDLALLRRQLNVKAAPASDDSTFEQGE